MEPSNGVMSDRIPNPYHWITNPDLDPAPDPGLFFSGFQDANEKLLLLLITYFAFAYYFL
jgi:hypothetical protein